MTHSGAEHCDAALVSLLDRILVADASAWLDNGLYAIFRSESDCVVEWEESV